MKENIGYGPFFSMLGGGGGAGLEMVRKDFQ